MRYLVTVKLKPGATRPKKWLRVVDTQLESTHLMSWLVCQPWVDSATSVPMITRVRPPYRRYAGEFSRLHQTHVRRRTTDWLQRTSSRGYDGGRGRG